MGIDLEEEGIYDPIKFKGNADYSISYLHQKVNDPDWPIIIQPDYQRDHVWTEDQKADFMGYMIEGNQKGADTQKLIFNDRGLPDGYAVVDGQQRIISILDFMENEIPARVTDPETGEDWNIYYEDLNDESKVILSHIRIPVGILEVSKEEAMEIYIRINSGGTVHSDDEIERVREMLNEGEDSDE